MKNALLPLLTAFVMAFAVPAHASYVIRKGAPEKTQPSANGENLQEKNTIAAPAANDAVASAVDEFHNLPRAERAERVHAVRDAVKNLHKPEHGDADTNTLLLVILAILLPPLAVGLFDHGLTTRFWLDVLLTLLFYVPGLVYALIVILG